MIEASTHQCPSIQDTFPLFDRKRLLNRH